MGLHLSGSTTTALNNAYVTPAARNPITGWFHATGFGAVGDGSTDNSAAIQAAYAAAVAAGGGTVYLPPRIGATGVTDYQFGTPLDFRSTSVPVTFKGASGWGDANDGVRLTYTGAGSTAAIKNGSSRSMKFESLTLGYNNAGFTGRLLDAQRVASDTAYLALTDVRLLGIGGAVGASTLLCIDGSHDVSLDRVRFANAAVGLTGKVSGGAGYAIRVNLKDCAFSGGLTSAAIMDGDNSWSINATFEPLTGGVPGAYKHTTGLYAGGVSFKDCWFGDETAAGAWITWAGDHLAIEGGTMSVQPKTTGVLIDADNLRGMKIRTQFYGQGAANKGVDFGTTAGHSGVEIVSVFTSVAQPVAGNVPSGALIGTGGGAYLTDPEFTGTVKVGQPGANMLTANQATPTTTTGFVSNHNATLSAAAGVLTTTTVDTSEMSFYLAAVPVTAGKQYTWQAEVDPGAATRQALMEITWLDAGNATVATVLRTATFGSPLTASGGYQRVSITAQAPVGATQLRAVGRMVSPTGAGEAYNWRKFSVARGTLQAWTAPATPAAEVILDVTNGLDLPEVTAPAAPSADRARIYARDNGSGKTSLAVRFNSDTEVVLATAGTAALDPSSFVTPKWATGGYYTGSQSGFYSTLAQTLNALYLTPLDVPGTSAIDRMGINVTAAAATGGVIRLGVYADVNGKPSTLLLDVGATYSTIDATTTGAKEVTLTSPLSLTGKGRVWLACVSQVAAGTLRTVGTGNDRRVQADTIAGATGVNGNNVYSQASVTGALPATLGGLTPGTQGPLIVARAA